ncbi:MAG: hypothetical protein ACRD3I_13715 [Terriglobales bacterium]
MLNVTIIFHTAPDALERRRFTLEWDDPSAPLYSQEPGREHICVGNGPGRRGQVFFCNPSAMLARYKDAIVTDGP